MKTAIVDAAKIIVEGSADSLMIVWYAVFAGAIGYFARAVREERKVTWSYALLEALASSVAGMVVALMRTWFGWPFEAGGIAALLLGFLGYEKSMKILEKFSFKKIGFDNDSDKKLD